MQRNATSGGPLPYASDRRRRSAGQLRSAARCGAVTACHPRARRSRGL